VVQFSRTPDASPPGEPDDGTNSVLGKARVILEAFDVEDDAVSLSELVRLEKVSGHHQVRRPSRIAGRMPLHCTATGKAILAYSPRGLLLDAVVEVGLPRVTRNTMVTPQRLAADLERVRHRGYSVEQEETKLGYLSVAAPLFGGGGSLVAAISVTGPVIRSNVDRLAGVLVPAARTITKRLRETDTGALYPVSGLPFTRVSVS
jgi:DNA-binding IclR family transcriptional regulator